MRSRRAQAGLSGGDGWGGAESQSVLAPVVLDHERSRPVGVVLGPALPREDVGQQRLPPAGRPAGRPAPPRPAPPRKSRPRPPDRSRVPTDWHRVTDSDTRSAPLPPGPCSLRVRRPSRFASAARLALRVRVGATADPDACAAARAAPQAHRTRPGPAAAPLHRLTPIGSPSPPFPHCPCAPQSESALPFRVRTARPPSPGRPARCPDCRSESSDLAPYRPRPQAPTRGPRRHGPPPQARLGRHGLGPVPASGRGGCVCETGFGRG